MLANSNLCLEMQISCRLHFLQSSCVQHNIVIHMEIGKPLFLSLSLSCLFIFLPFSLARSLTLSLCLSVYILPSLSFTNSLTHMHTHTAPQWHEISSCPINRCRGTKIEHVSSGAVPRWQGIHHDASLPFPRPAFSQSATLPGALAHHLCYPTVGK